MFNTIDDLRNFALENGYKLISVDESQICVAGIVVVKLKKISKNCTPDIGRIINFEKTPSIHWVNVNIEE